MDIHKKFLFVPLVMIMALGLGFGQGRITAPKDQFGFDIGADYVLVGYTQLAAYWQKLAQESDRISLEKIGTTAEGRPMLMAVITSAANQKKLSHYKTISRQLALAEGLTEKRARSLASQGKAVIQIDGGLHATEVLGAQQLVELVYQMASRNDAETLRILDNVILLAIPSNPDGMDLIAEWYMREKEPAKRTTRWLPRLYQKYIGHDNNRDFYMVTQPETEAISRVMYLEWFPQIVYNHHQTGPSGTVLFCSPFRDPFNYFFDPFIPMGIELVGSAMHARFVAEGKPGATMRSGASYSTWWSGGLRSTSYFHNMIGILTETIGNPTPTHIPFLPDKQLPGNDLPFPVAPQEWHFRQSIDYSITADKAILDLAAKLREDFLLNVYRMGRNSIERGSRDHWTLMPKRIEVVKQAIKSDNAKLEGLGFDRGYPVKYYDLLRDPAARDPRGYIIPAGQPDFPTATKFINALIKSGIAVERATKAFEVGGTTYPEDSHIIKCSQAFRPHILAMFEPQDHPHDVPYPGGPPNAPYDSAGWTLAYQAGIVFERVLEGFDGPFEKVKGLARLPAGKVTAGAHPAGYLLDHCVNNVFIAANRLLKGAEEVYWLKDPFEANGKTHPAGTIFVPAKALTLAKLEDLAASLGLNIEGTAVAPQGRAFHLKQPRLGLWDIYGGSMSSGWARWLLEQYEFPFQVVYPPDLEAGDLAERFDILIFPSGAIPPEDREPEDEFHWYAQPKPEEIPEEFRSRLGTVTISKTVPFLRKFLQEGGTILAIGSSTSLGLHAELPLSDALVEELEDGSHRRLPREKYYIPGSILSVKVDNNAPLAYGMKERADVYFNNSPVFRLHPEATARDVHPVAWFSGPTPLRSGWAWGQHYLDQGVAVLEARMGKGKLFIYGPEIIFRGQPQGTFKFFFNGIFYGSAADVNLPKGE